VCCCCLLARRACVFGTYALPRFVSRLCSSNACTVHTTRPYRRLTHRDREYNPYIHTRIPVTAYSRNDGHTLRSTVWLTFCGEWMWVGADSRPRFC
jgi:hypothetical protein